jgi:iron complex transport system substrate-binding protein
MDDLAALGVAPIGGLTYPAGTTGFDSRGIPSEISSQVPSSFKSVGTAPSTPDLETIAALHPDLIVGVDGKGTADLKQLEAIAPVVSPAPTTPTGNGIGTLAWVSEVQLLGKVLDRQPQAASFIAKFQAAAAPVQKAVAGKTVDLVVLASASTFTLIGSRFQPAGHFLAYLGLSLPDSFPGAALTSGGTHGTYSTEHVNVLTGQYLVLGHTVAASSALYTQFLANALVKKLPAVKAGHVIQTEGDESFGSGFLTAGAVGQLDALPAIQQAFGG